MAASLLWIAIEQRNKSREGAGLDIPLFPAWGILVSEFGSVPLTLNIGVVTDSERHVLTTNVNDPSGNSVKADRYTFEGAHRYHHGDFDAKIMPIRFTVFIPFSAPGIYNIRGLLDGEPLFQLGFPVALGSP